MELLSCCLLSFAVAMDSLFETNAIIIEIQFNNTQFELLQIVQIRLLLKNSTNSNNPIFLAVWVLDHPNHPQEMIQLPSS